MSSNGDLHDRAREYVDRVLDSQRELGHEPRISPEAYETAVTRAEEAFASLSDPTTPELEDGAVC